MSSVDKSTLVNELVNNKVYIWTTRSEYFPKVTDSMILWTKDKQIVIDPEKIADKLISVKEKVDSAIKEGKSIVVVFDKEAFREEVKDVCTSAGVSYLNYKVPSGIFTNFETFSKRIHSLNKLKKFIESPAFEKITKKEQLMKKRELAKRIS